MACNHKKRYKVIEIRVPRKNPVVPGDDHYTIWHCPSCNKATSDYRNEYVYQKSKWYDAKMYVYPITIKEENNE